MFKYNELSDLKNGKLVTPIRCTDDDTIICIDEFGMEVELDFNDFDFDKTIDERLFIVDDGDDSEEIITEPEPEEEILQDNSYEDVIQEPEPEEIIKPLPDEEVLNEKNSASGWIEEPSKKLEILNMFGYDYKDLKKINIWKDTVL